jgi:hypothetical protein
MAIAEMTLSEELEAFCNAVNSRLPLSAVIATFMLALFGKRLFRASGVSSSTAAMPENVRSVIPPRDT